MDPLSFSDALLSQGGLGVVCFVLLLLLGWMWTRIADLMKKIGELHTEMLAREDKSDQEKQQLVSEFNKATAQLERVVELLTDMLKGRK